MIFNVGYAPDIHSNEPGISADSFIFHFVFHFRTKRKKVFPSNNDIHLMLSAIAHPNLSKKIESA